MEWLEKLMELKGAEDEENEQTNKIKPRDKVHKRP